LEVGKPGSVFERYAIVSQTDISEAVRKLEIQQKSIEIGIVPTRAHNEWC